MLRRGMKAAILVTLLVIAVLLSALLYLLFQPGAGYQASQTSLRSRQAAVGRAVLAAAQLDPAVTAMVQAAVQAAPEEDRSLAADLMAALRKQ